MALIKLTGKHAVGAHAYAIVDDELAAELSCYRWKAKPNGDGNNVYAVRNSRLDGKHITIRMHRVVAGLAHGDPREPDHRNHNSLDNRKANLKVGGRSANIKNARTVTITVPCRSCGVPVTRTLSSCGAKNKPACDRCRRRYVPVDQRGQAPSNP